MVIIYQLWVTTKVAQLELTQTTNSRIVFSQAYIVYTLISLRYATEKQPILTVLILH